jgi:hypothetical protein
VRQGAAIPARGKGSALEDWKGGCGRKASTGVRFVLVATRMTTLRSQLEALAGSFAGDVLEAVRGMSLQELVSETGDGRGNGRSAPTVPRGAAPAAQATANGAKRGRAAGRLKRRSPQDIAQALGKVVALVRQHKQGLRAEQIRKQLGMQPSEMPRVLKDGLSSKKLKAKGQKRATTYFPA